MSESLAAFRDKRSGDLRRLAEEHLQHDLNQSDRDILKSAGSKVSTHAKIGSLLGLGFGVYCAVRLRSMRLAYFNAFRAMEKPVELKFADGRTRTLAIPLSNITRLSQLNFVTEPIPDVTDQIRPSKWADAATYFFFSLGGLFLGGEAGFLTGTGSASRTITKDPEAKQRIEKAFRSYRIDVLKQEIRNMESNTKLADFFG